MAVEEIFAEMYGFPRRKSRDTAILVKHGIMRLASLGKYAPRKQFLSMQLPA
jgi:hypothetical protein